jgi:hypothetical protein
MMFKPTTNKPQTNQGKKFEKNFNHVMNTNRVNLEEIDSILSEKKQSLKRKIFSLDKMEALVHSDPKLSAVYNEMAEDGREKYGYHYNETIMNIIFNEYILNSPKYITKYKRTIPKKKKRRDKSGIEQLKKDLMPIEKKRDMKKEKTDESWSGSKKPAAGAQIKDGEVIPDANETVTATEFRGGGKKPKKDTTEEIVDETSTTGSAGGHGMGSGGYATPHFWSGSEKPMMKKPFWHGGVALLENKTTPKKPFWRGGVIAQDKDPQKLVPRKESISKKPFWQGGSLIKESNYLIDPSGFEKYAKSMSESFEVSEHHLNNREEKIEFIKKNMNSPSVEKTLPNLKDDEVDRIYTALEKKMGVVKETTLPMIDQGTDSMSNKAQPTGDVGANMERGVQMNEHHLTTKEDKVRFLVMAGKILMGDLGNLAPAEVFEKMENELMQEDDWKIDELYSETEKLLKKRGIDPKGIVPGKMSTVIGINEDDSWTGTDADLETSLFEYGFVAKQPQNKDYPDEWFVLYRINDDAFGTGWIRESELNAIIEGKEWADEKDIAGFLESVGSGSKEEWLQLSFQHKFSDLINHWGYENIMGTDYSPINKGEAEKMLNSTQLDENLLKAKKIINELDETKKQQEGLKSLFEDRRPSSLVLKDRLGKDNESNFKSDLNKSGTKDVVDHQNDLQHQKQQTTVGDPQKLGRDLEKEALKKTSGEALKNVGNSANKKGDEIPKRNHTEDEQNEVDLYRIGLGDYIYDNKPDERFEERMKDGMGEKNYEMRQKKMEFRSKAPMYNKDTQPMGDGDEKAQFNKEKVKWGERTTGLKECAVSAKYTNKYGKNSIIDFYIKEAVEKPNADKSWYRLNFDGLGNKYTNTVELNEGVGNLLNEFAFYTNDSKNVFVVKNAELIKEGKKLNEGVDYDKIKHLTNYNPATYVKTQNTKKNRGF